MSKVLVLGGHGFVGRNIVEVLNERNIPFEIASRRTGVDLTDTEQVFHLLKRVRPKFIVNCAAVVGSLNYVTRQAADVIVVNSKMALSLYEAVAKACPDAIIINPIANCAYPGKAEIYSEEYWQDGHIHRSVLSFGSSRRFLWSVGESFAIQHGIKSIYLLVPNMYGPYESTDPDKAHALNALIGKFVKASKENKPSITVWGTGSAIREWLYAKDFGRIVARIILDPRMPELSEPTNVAQNFGLSVKELVDIIGKNHPFKGSIEWDKNMPDGAPKKVMDDRKFRKIFPDFKFTELSEGIKNTIEYYNSIYPY